MRTFKHLTFTDRLQIEAWRKIDVSPRIMAQELNVHISTIYRELKRGEYEHLNSDYTTEIRYSPDIAQQRAEANYSAMGAALKIGSDYEFAEYIEKKIVKEKYSPAAVLGEIEAQGLKFDTTICVRTLYNYIDKGIFLHLTNKNLTFKGKRKRKYRKTKKIAREPRGESIEKRPEEIAERSSFGNWEMDTVEGKKKTKNVLLVLSERLTRNEIVVKLKDKSAQSVVDALNRLERKYGAAFPKIFKTITVDNGTEFSDCAGIERSINGGKRTRVYYCHPYSSWERGTNENINRMIRRHYPKGSSFVRVSAAAIQAVEDWINNYPRGIFDYHTAAELFEKELAGIL